MLLNSTWRGARADDKAVSRPASPSDTRESAAITTGMALGQLADTLQVLADANKLRLNALLLLETNIRYYSDIYILPLVSGVNDTPNLASRRALGALRPSPIDS